MKKLQKINLEHNILREAILRRAGVLPSQRCEFLIPTVTSEAIISAMNFYDNDFEHVMLNPYHRLPTYEEMVYIKDLFWEQSEVAMQVYPAKSEYVNLFEYALHLWRFKKIGEKTEKRLIEKIKMAYEEAKNFQHHEKDTIFCDGKLIIFGGSDWPTWSEVCSLKEKYWEPESAAVQFNVGKDIDLNSEHCIILWDAEDMILPKKEFV